MTTQKLEVKHRKNARVDTPTRRAPGADLPALVMTILDGPASLAANTANDARSLALRLHNARDPEAMAALRVALAVRDLATGWHAVAEMIAQSMTASEWSEWSGGDAA